MYNVETMAHSQLVEYAKQLQAQRQRLQQSLNQLQQSLNQIHGRPFSERVYMAMVAKIDYQKQEIQTLKERVRELRKVHLFEFTCGGCGLRTVTNCAIENEIDTEIIPEFWKPKRA